jgi:DHA1 family tetracycline resistance protein-like MFS transporter
MADKSNRALLFIFITILVDVIGLGIIIPVVPKLIEDLTGEGLSEASRYGGWLIFSFAAMQFLFSPIMGGLSDRFGPYLGWELIMYFMRLHRLCFGFSWGD